MSAKPTINIECCDGNIYAIAAEASKALRRNGQRADIDDMCKKITTCNSYTDALNVIQDYVEFE